MVSFLNKHKMTPLRALIKQSLIRMTGNRFSQNLLEEVVQTAHILQGVGGGSVGSSEVHSSGETAIFALLREIAIPPYTVFDVGANRGQFLQELLDNIGNTDCSIHCFEPGKTPFTDLAAAYGNDSRTRLNNIGLGNDRGEKQIFYDVAGSGCASLTKRNLDHLGIYFDQSELISLTTLDEYCAENGVDEIDLVKIDVEGHELDVLNGAHRMFDARAINMVSFEFGGCNVDTRTFFQDFWYFFASAGMKLFRITPSGYLYPIEVYSEIHEKFGVSNMVAVRNH